MENLSQYQIKTLPGMYYIPNFISKKEEDELINSIYKEPPSRWKLLSHRRLQVYPGPLSKNGTLITGKLPSWLINPCVNKMNEIQIWKDTTHKSTNHCLINEYKPGEGIMAHEDGNSYFPMVATISLGSGIVLDIYKKDVLLEKNIQEPSYRIYQEPRSLLITTGNMYKNFLHGIQNITKDINLNQQEITNWDLLNNKDILIRNNGINERKLRISLTFRDVTKVANNVNIIFKMK